MNKITNYKTLLLVLQHELLCDTDNYLHCLNRYVTNELDNHNIKNPVGRPIAEISLLVYYDFRATIERLVERIDLWGGFLEDSYYRRERHIEKMRKLGSKEN
jgi:hypothetical protein